MKRNHIMFAIALAVAVFSLGAQAMGIDVAVAFAAHPDALAGLSALAFIGDTQPVTLDDIKGQLQDMGRDHKTAMKDAKDASEKALDEVKRLGTLTTETNVKLTEAGEKTVKLQTDLLDLQQKFEKISTRVTSFDQHEASKSVGLMVVESDEFKAAQKSSAAGKHVMDPVMVGSLRKTAIVNAPLNANQPLVTPERAAFVMPAQRPLVIRDLIPTRPTTSNLVQFAQENVFTNNAAVVINLASPDNNENVTKPESGITYKLTDAPVVTIAHWIPASRQVLSDAPMLQGLIEDRLLYGVELAEEDQILNGDGTTGYINGLMHQATAYAGAGAVSADTQLDTLLRAMTQCFTNSLFYPDGTVINPIDWTKIRLIKDTQGRYVFGDPNSNQAPSVWGLRLVQSLTIASTRFLVGAFRAGAGLWDREEASIRIAEQHSDFFVKNMVAILCEDRMTLTVYRPAAFIRGNFN